MHEQAIQADHSKAVCLRAIPFNSRWGPNVENINVEKS